MLGSRGFPGNSISHRNAFSVLPILQEYLSLANVTSFPRWDITSLGYLEDILWRNRYSSHCY